MHFSLTLFYTIKGNGSKHDHMPAKAHEKDCTYRGGMKEFRFNTKINRYEYYFVKAQKKEYM